MAWPATTPFFLPETAVGLDTIQAVYNGTASFAQSQPSDASLTIDSGATTTTASDQTTYYDTAAQSVTLNADVTSEGFAVNEGMVTFTILNGSTPVGSPTPAEVSEGIATTSYSLPPGVASDIYTIKAVYDDSETMDYVGSTDTGHTLTITEPPPYQLAIATAAVAKHDGYGRAVVQPPAGHLCRGSGRRPRNGRQQYCGDGHV